MSCHFITSCLMNRATFIAIACDGRNKFLPRIYFVGYTFGYAGKSKTLRKLYSYTNIRAIDFKETTLRMKYSLAGDIGICKSEISRSVSVSKTQIRQKWS